MTLKAIFQDRREAGRALASRLGKYARKKAVTILALPRGGVPVAYEVAKALQLPLDVFCVRKLGVPGHEELAMGAIASGGARVLNGAVVEELGIPDEVIDSVAAREMAEIDRREAVYRGDKPLPVIEGQTVIVVDDGLATGATMKAAVMALRQMGAARIVVAVPTAALSSAKEIGHDADEVIALITPVRFQAVGEWYEDFSQTSDHEVMALLALAAKRTSERAERAAGG